MNKRQVIILWSIAAVLAVVIATIKFSQSSTTETATKRKPGDTLLESFPAEQVASITIKGADNTITLKQSGDQWVVANRDDYPADVPTVLELIRQIEDVEITRGIEAGPTFAPRFGMDPQSDLPQDHGLELTFSDAEGQQLARVTLGKPIENAADAGPMGGSMIVGRYIRNHADDSGFYATSEMFSTVNADAANWLRDSFISPEKIESVSLTEEDSDKVAWKVSRASEEAAFQLADAAANELANASNAARLNGLLSYARFNDVVPADEVVGRSAEKGKRTAVISTFEGFTYTLALTPAVDRPDEFLMTVEVDALLPAERKKTPGETEDQAKQLDEAFNTRLATLTDKLNEAKFYEGRTYLIDRSTIDSLLKKRSEMVTTVQPDQPQTPASKPSE